MQGGSLDGGRVQGDPAMTAFFELDVEKKQPELASVGLSKDIATSIDDRIKNNPELAEFLKFASIDEEGNVAYDVEDPDKPGWDDFRQYCKSTINSGSNLAAIATVRFIDNTLASPLKTAQTIQAEVHPVLYEFKTFLSALSAKEPEAVKKASNPDLTDHGEKFLLLFQRMILNKIQTDPSANIGEFNEINNILVKLLDGVLLEKDEIIKLEPHAKNFEPKMFPAEVEFKTVLDGVQQTQEDIKNNSLRVPSLLS
jgi:hypothetical protein